MNQRHHARQPSHGRKVLPPHARPSKPPLLTSRKSYNNGQSHGHGHTQSQHSRGASQTYLSPNKTSCSSTSKKVGSEIQEVTDDEEEFGMASFLQFCATCERQIVTPNASILYCSEACRRRDSRPTSMQELQAIQQSIQSPPPLSSTASYFHQNVPEIVPQMSPTSVLRPISQAFSDLDLSDVASLSETWSSASGRRDSKYPGHSHSDFSVLGNTYSTANSKTHRPRVSRTSTTGTRGDSSTNLPSLVNSPSSSYGTVASNASYRPVIKHNPFSTTSMSTKSIDLVIPYPTENISPAQLLKDASLKSTASTLTSFKVAEANDLSYYGRSSGSRRSSREYTDNTLKHTYPDTIR